MKSMGRREFLRQGALGAAAVTVFPTAAPTTLDAASRAVLGRRRDGRKIIVVGAGLAGLSAAYELTRLGHDVTVLEARMRPGGRVRTLRAPFADGLYAEAGARFVPDIHDLTWHYLKLFDLPVDAPAPSATGTVWHLRGRRLVVRGDAHPDIPFDLTPEERALGGGIWSRYRPQSVFDEIGDPAAPGWSPAALAKYDDLSHAGFLRSQGASSEFIAFATSGGTGEGADEVSALSVLVDLADERRASHWYTIRGGSDRLPDAFATVLAERIRYGSPVVRIEHGAGGARVVFIRAAEHHAVTGDHVVCAIPFSVLKNIDVSPPFSAGKRRAIERLPYRSVARVFLQASRKFWLDEALDGDAWTDLPIGNLSSTPPTGPGTRGILQTYVAGPEARALIPLSEPERIAFTLEQVDKVYPGARAYFEGGVSKSWDEDRWARGASSWYRPGQMTELWPHIARPEGRIHFAGDHTSARNRWMQGALESGQRVAREIEGWRSP